MNKFTGLLACTLPILAGCGALKDTVIVTKSGEALTPSQYYQAVYTDGESDIYDHITTTGVTGFVGNPDGTVSEILVRVDIEAETAYVSIDGGEEIVFDQIAYWEGNEIEFVNAAAQWAYVQLNDYGPTYVEFGEDEVPGYGAGYFGLETAPEALPTQTAMYSGGWNARGGTDTTGIYASARMELAVGFASGNVTGYTNGWYEAWDDVNQTSDYGDFLGGVTGTVSGSRIAGTMTVDGDASGQLDLMGAIYGDNAEYAAGGVGGSLTSDVGTQNLGGSFYLYQDEGCGPWC